MRGDETARFSISSSEVLTREEVLAVIGNLSVVYELLVQVLYSCGLRLTEGLHLWVKDLDFAQQQIVVRNCFGAGEPSDDAADECDRAFEGAFGAGEVAASAGSRPGLWLGVPAVCLGA